MKKRVIILISFISILIGITSIFIYKNKLLKEDNLINIDKLSEEFMDNYIEEYNNLEEKEKEDMLIVISKEKLKAEKYGATKVIEGPNNKYYLTFIDDIKKEKAIKEIKQEEYIKSVEENIKREFFVTENSENIQNDEIYNSWGIKKIGLDYAKNIVSNLDINEINVAIIDTGLDTNLFNKYYEGRIKETYNVLESNNSMYDNFGHGTHIAGTIAEGTPDNVKIIPVKVSDDQTLYESEILLALDYITYYTEVDVINMSFGGYEYSEAEYIAIEAARQKNIIAVAAAGNENTEELSYPAAFDNTISIASVDSNLVRSEFSNYGETIDFAAPGSDIKSIMASYMYISSNEDGDDDHETISGTSMATPHAVSAVAILKSLNKEITLENTIDLLKNKVIDLGAKDFDMYYGNGLINYNESDFCTNKEMNCDEFKIFKIIKPTSMTVNEVKLTNYNYGSLNNILGTKVYFEETDGLNYTKELWELENLSITGYDPYNNDTQTVTIKYLDFETTFEVDNPDNYESGWEYQLYNEKYYLSKYKDNGLNIGKLYFPETIDGFTITGILDSNDYDSEINDFNSKIFNDSNDANYFEEIILPSNITEIGMYAFTRLPKCTKVISQSNELIVNYGSFSNMPNLTTVEGNIVFSETSYYVFKDDISLQNVNISENTADILPDGAFCGCVSLKNMILPDSITTIGESAFSGSGLNTIELSKNIKGIKSFAFNGNNIENIILPDSLETIEMGAFYNNNLQSINIPKNVNNIGSEAFLSNLSLDNITVDKENKIYDSRDNSNLIIETSTNKIIQGSNHAIIPSTVITIGENSFSGLLIEELTVPEGVKNIEKDAFMQSYYLKKIVLPKSLTDIHESVFSNFENYDEEQLLGAPTSGSYTGIRTTVLWVHKDSYAHNFAINNNKTYVIIDDSSNVVEILFVGSLLKKNVFYPGDKIEDYVESISYVYTDGEEFFEKNVQDFTVEYQNGDSVSINDYAAYIKFNLEHSYQNIKIPIYIKVVEGKSDLELPSIEAVIGDSIYEYNYPDGKLTLYERAYFDKPGEYKVLGDYKPNNSEEIYYSVEVTINVLDKELVYDFAQTIITKFYDGTTYVDPNNVYLTSYKQSIENSDYTIVSAVLDSPDVNNNSLVRIKARINDDSFGKFAFSGNKQEAEFTGYMTVTDFEIPEYEINLLINEPFVEYCFDDGCLREYGSQRYDQPGEYNIIGYYSSNDGSTMIENLPITLNVINKKWVASWVDIEPKRYDGTTNIDLSTITLSGMERSQYNILTVELFSPEVNIHASAKIKIKLTDETYEEYGFTGNEQEMEWNNPMKVIKATPKYNIPSNLKGKLGQKLSDILLPEGFEWLNKDELLDKTGLNNYKAKYTPSDTLNYEIVENIDIQVEVLSNDTKYASSDYIGIYDGKEHTISLNVNLDNYEIKYSVNNNNYNLTTLPKFKDVGEYTINYKITSPGYEILTGSNKVIIYGIKKFDSTIEIRDNILITKNNSFNNLFEKIHTFATRTDYFRYNKNNIETTLDTIKTGDYIKIKINNTKDFKYYLSIIGDVSGDGKISSADYVKIRKHIMQTEVINDNIYFYSADITKDNKITSADYIRIRKYIMNGESL